MALVAAMFAVGAMLFVACEKEETKYSDGKPAQTVPLKIAGSGCESGFSIWLDGKKDKTGKCKKSLKLHFCVDWPWSHLTEISELEKMKASYMVPVYCDSVENKLDMMFDYSFLSDDEVRVIESDLGNMQTLEFPSVNIQTGNEFESIGLHQNVSLIEGLYPIVSWSKDERNFVLTIDFIPIEKE